MERKNNEPIEVPVTKELAVTKEPKCPFCKITMHPKKVNYFSSVRRTLKARVCGRCGFVAFFDAAKNRVVVVGERVISETVTFV